MRYHGDLVSRLWNWAAYARHDPDRPDSSCQNSFWDQIVNEKEGDGEVTAETVRVVYADPVKGAPEVDELDAEVMDTWIRQLKSPPKISILTRRFVLREPLPWYVVDPVIRALVDLMEANARAVDRVRALGAP